MDLSNPIQVPSKAKAAKFLLSYDDPGDKFEMSEWKDYKIYSPKTSSVILCLAKKHNGEIFKAIYFFGGYPINWCTYEEGYRFPDKDIKEWAYIRRIGGEDRKDVQEWKKVMSETTMSGGEL